ncbi:hypothetical protein B0H16DRAFT_1809602 [Mycena metata]|uniref:Uncharacterized protein n=1 Tax=Mycena metata TaxID=1033252 RepID=A0AAD7MED8_9AGAR|nr:hypothetical protein B0H16DRAFT_1809602 [Mycena metata]
MGLRVCGGSYKGGVRHASSARGAQHPPKIAWRWAEPVSIPLPALPPTEPSAVKEARRVWGGFRGGARNTRAARRAPHAPKLRGGGVGPARAPRTARCPQNAPNGANEVVSVLRGVRRMCESMHSRYPWRSARGGARPLNSRRQGPVLMPLPAPGVKPAQYCRRTCEVCSGVARMPAAHPRCPWHAAKPKIARRGGRAFMARGALLAEPAHCHPEVRRWTRAWVAVGLGYRVQAWWTHITCSRPGRYSLKVARRRALMLLPALIAECAIHPSSGREGVQGIVLIIITPVSTANPTRSAMEGRPRKVLINRSTPLIDVNVDDGVLIAEAMKTPRLW